MKLQLKTINPKRIMLLVSSFVLLSGGLSGYFWYRSHITSSNYFLQVVNQYDGNAQSLQNNWPSVVSKAKTPLQFMILLKRLDKWDLLQEYRNTLVRALWKYPEVKSFLALAIEYYLSHQDGDIFDEYLQEVDILWNEYPNLLRLYYIDLFEKKGIKNQQDELLQLFYLVANKQETWQTLSTLWQLTDNPMFLYLAGISASMEGEDLIAQTLYESFPLEWQALYAEYFESLAWVVHDIDFLQPVVESKQDIEQHIRLAGIYIGLNRVQEAYKLLHDYLVSFPEQAKEHNSFLEVYLWLANTIEGYSAIEKQAEEVLASNNTNLIKSYILYSAKFNSDNVQAVLNSIDDSLKAQMLEDPLFYFLVNYSDPHVTIEFMQALFWKTMEQVQEAEDAQLKNRLLHIALRYFLHNDLFDDYRIIIPKALEYPEIHIPYTFYYSVKYNPEDNAQAIQTIAADSNDIEFEWWHYYNLGVYKLAFFQYQQAELFLMRALEMLENNSNSQESRAFPLVQLARLYIEQKQFDSGRYYLQELQSLFPTNAYAEELENRLKFQTSAIEGEQ